MVPRCRRPRGGAGPVPTRATPTGSLWGLGERVHSRNPDLVRLHLGDGASSSGVGMSPVALATGVLGGAELRGGRGGGRGGPRPGAAGPRGVTSVTPAGDHLPGAAALPDQVGHPEQA